MPNLPHLIRLGHRLSRLKIQDLFDVFPGIDVVIATNTFREADGLQKRAKILEVDVRIGRASKDALERLLPLRHRATIARPTSQIRVDPSRPSNPWPGIGADEAVVARDHAAPLFAIFASPLRSLRESTSAGLVSRKDRKGLAEIAKANSG